MLCKTTVIIWSEESLGGENLADDIRAMYSHDATVTIKSTEEQIQNPVEDKDFDIGDEEIFGIS